MKLAIVEKKDAIGTSFWVVRRPPLFGIPMLTLRATGTPFCPCINEDDSECIYPTYYEVKYNSVKSAEDAIEIYLADLRENKFKKKQRRLYRRYNSITKVIKST